MWVGLPQPGAAVERACFRVHLSVFRKGINEGLTFRMSVAVAKTFALEEEVFHTVPRLVVEGPPGDTFRNFFKNRSFLKSVL